MSAVVSIPPEAFTFYLERRSIRAVAEKFGVDDSEVKRVARIERWAERATEQDRTVAEDNLRRQREVVRSMNERHGQIARFGLSLAADAMTKHPITSASVAARVAEVMSKLERLAMGEPTDRMALGVEDMIRREYARWMVSSESTKEHRGIDPDRNGAGGGVRSGTRESVLEDPAQGSVALEP